MEKITEKTIELGLFSILISAVVIYVNAISILNH